MREKVQSETHRSSRETVSHPESGNALDKLSRKQGMVESTTTIILCREPLIRSSRQHAGRDELTTASFESTTLAVETETASVELETASVELETAKVESETEEGRVGNRKGSSRKQKRVESDTGSLFGKG